MHSTAGASSPGTSGSRRYSLILLHGRIRKRIQRCHFCTLIDIVAETAIVSFHTLPVGLPLPTISKNSLYTLFCPLILDYGVLPKFSISTPKILISNSLGSEQKRFPTYHVCPKYLAAHLCGSAFLQNGSAFHQELDQVGKIQVDC